MRRVPLASVGLCLVLLGAEAAWSAESAGQTVAQPSKSKDDDRRAQVAALKDRDATVRRQAADTLGRIGDKATVEPLIAGLKDGDRGVRWSVARSLGMLGDRRAVEPLIAALKDQDAWVRSGVAEALGFLGDKRAVKPLHAALRRDGGSENEAVACALAAIVRDETAVEPLLTALEHPSSEWTGLMVFGALMQIGPPAVKPLVAALPRSNERMRKDIVLALTHLGDDRAVEPLIKTLADSKGDVARAAALGLARLDAPRAVAPLVAAVKDRHSALWRVDEFTPQDKLTGALPGLAAGMPADLAPLVSAMEDSHWELRYSAAWVLGRLGNKQATEALATVLKSAEQAPTLEGVWLCGLALARLQSPLGIAPLVRVVKEHDEGDKGKHEIEFPGLDWLRRMRQKEISTVLEAFVTIGPAAADPLIGFLKDENPVVRAVSAQALGRLGDKRAIDALKGASNDLDQRVRDSAAEAIRTINSNAQDSTIKTTPKAVTNSIGMKLVLIPAGEFLMGSPDSDDMVMPQEKPQHRVRITRPFYLGACEVTQSQYQQVMGKNPSRSLGDPQRPVESVSWNDAVEFCRRLGELPEEKAVGAVYRLPTEAQWEYASRAGTTKRYCFGDEKERLADYAWYLHDRPTIAPGVPAKETPAANADPKRLDPHPVGLKKPNAWGLYDVHGNVWEWCADWYGPYKAESPADDPTGPASGSTRVVRGGSARDIYANYLRSAMRTSMRPDYRGGEGIDCGFRVVREHGQR